MLWSLRQLSGVSTMVDCVLVRKHGVYIIRRHDVFPWRRLGEMTMVPHSTLFPFFIMGVIFYIIFILHNGCYFHIWGSSQWLLRVFLNGSRHFLFVLFNLSFLVFRWRSWISSSKVWHLLGLVIILGECLEMRIEFICPTYVTFFIFLSHSLSWLNCTCSH